MTPAQVDALAQALRDEAEQERRTPSKASAQFNANATIGREAYALQIATCSAASPCSSTR